MVIQARESISSAARLPRSTMRCTFASWVFEIAPTSFSRSVIAVRSGYMSMRSFIARLPRRTWAPTSPVRIASPYASDALYCGLASMAGRPLMSAVIGGSRVSGALTLRAKLKSIP